MSRFKFVPATLAAIFFLHVQLPAQTPCQFPTANHALYEQGNELKFFAPTSPERSWTTGSFGCVRSEGWQMHEGLDIRSLQHDRHDEPTDPVMATADGTVMYVSTHAALSNYGKYVVIRHVIDGIDLYSLYAHLSEIAPGVATGKVVKRGEVIATMGRTSNTSEHNGKERAHVHFELNLLVNDNFNAWFKKNMPGERNDHGVWNGQNLNGLDPREILLAERTGKFSLLEFLRGQTELCRVQVRVKSFPFLKRYAPLVLKNPRADREGVAGWELALNYNAVAFALRPLAESEMMSRGKFQLLAVNAKEYQAHPCRKLVALRGGRWQLGDKGLRELELLTD